METSSLRKRGQFYVSFVTGVVEGVARRFGKDSIWHVCCGQMEDSDVKSPRFRKVPENLASVLCTTRVGTIGDPPTSAQRTGLEASLSLKSVSTVDADMCEMRRNWFSSLFALIFICSARALVGEQHLAQAASLSAREYRAIRKGDLSLALQRTGLSLYHS